MILRARGREILDQLSDGQWHTRLSVCGLDGYKRLSKHGFIEAQVFGPGRGNSTKIRITGKGLDAIGGIS